MSFAADDWAPADAWLVVLDSENDATHCDVSELHGLDAAVTAYVESAGTRDQVLHLTMSEGGTFCILASRVSAWWVSTPEHRRRNLIRQREQRSADRELRAALGMPWEEEA